MTDLVQYWDWRAWLLVLLLVGVLGRMVWRYLCALAFHWLLLPRMVARRGWVDHGDKSWFDHATFDEQQRRRGRKGRRWLAKKGLKGIWEGYARGIFAKSAYSPPQFTVDITGTYRGYEFLAQQHRRLAQTVGSEGRTQRKFVHKSSLEVRDADMSLPTGTISVSLLTGHVETSSTITLTPTLEKLLKRRRLYVRAYRVTPAFVTVSLVGRLYRARLLRGLDLLVEITDDLLRNR